MFRIDNSSQVAIFFEMVCYEFGINIVFDEKRAINHCSASPIDGYIKLPKKFSSARMAYSAFFHEIGHFLDYRDGKFKTVYECERYSENGRKIYSRNVFNLEKSADLRGRSAMKEYCAQIPYLRQCTSVHKGILLRHFRANLAYLKKMTK